MRSGGRSHVRRLLRARRFSDLDTFERTLGTWPPPLLVARNLAQGKRASACVGGAYRFLVANASHESTAPVSKPRLNQRTRCSGAAVRERFRRDVAARLLLQTIVADRGGGVQSFFDVARLEHLSTALQVRPDAGEAVRLQFLTNRARSLPRARALARGHVALGNAEQRLHVVSDFMRDDVRLREVAGRTRPALQVLVERQVDVNVAIAGTIERPDGRPARIRKPVRRRPENSTSVGG